MISRRASTALSALAASVFLALGLLGAAGCSEIEDDSPEIAVTRLFLVDPFQRQPTLFSAPAGALASLWSVETAVLDLGERGTVDLLADDPSCELFDTLVTTPSGSGGCAGGRIAEAFDEPQDARLRIALTWSVARLEPALLDRNGDADADGFPNFIDSCPLRPNGICSADPTFCDLDGDGTVDDNEQALGNQADADGDGIGDACQVIDPFDLVSTFVDSDGDTVPDFFDNCIYFANVDQVDSSVPPDGIGDACPTQSADVVLDGDTRVELELDVPSFRQPENRIALVTVDLSSARALDCDWVGGTCTLRRDEVRACFTDSPDVAGLGCL